MQGVRAKQEEPGPGSDRAVAWAWAWVLAVEALVWEAALQAWAARPGEAAAPRARVLALAALERGEVAGPQIRP